MAHAWDAEQTIEPEMAMQMIADQFPHLAPRKIELLGAGWDNTAFLVNDEWVFRFPRRQIALPFLENEFCILPKIAKSLPLSIPIPQWKGSATQDYPWPFAGYLHLPGISACQVRLSIADRMQLTQPLAHFLKALHVIPLSVAGPCKLPGDLLDRLNVNRLIEKIRKNLEELFSLELVKSVHLFDIFLDRAQHLNPPRNTVIVHGDFYVRHLLVNKHHKLIGVIDWGDVHLGNCAVDLSVAHSVLPIQAHAQFKASYGEIDEETWLLARLRALYHSSQIAIYGYHSKDSAIHREGIWALEQMTEQS